MDAPELTQIAAWINTEPLTLEQLQGEVVLLDFWTYTDLGCRRTLPAVQLLWNSYQDYPVTFIGVHIPRFSFETEDTHVQRTVEDLGIGYPVALDAEGATWERYGNHVRPRQAVIDPEGVVIHEHTGPGGGPSVEAAIREQLLIQDFDLDDPVFDRDDDERVFVDPVPELVSPPLYPGERYGSVIGNVERITPHTTLELKYPPNQALNMIYLDGAWRQEDEYIVSESGESSLNVRFIGKTAHLVLHHPDEAVQVSVELDGSPVPAGDESELVRTEGETTLPVSNPDLYTVLHRDEARISELTLHVPAGCRVYSLAFG